MITLIDIIRQAMGNATRIALCQAHADAVREAMPYPAQGLHFLLFQKPVDVVPGAACVVPPPH